MLHDKELLNYIVNFKTNSIQLSFDNNITLEFKNIFIYKFYDETKGSIILEIVEEDIENFFSDNAEYILENNNYGAPIFYATPEELKKYIINKNFKYYKIYASYGFNGWILCEDIMSIGA